MSFHHSCPFNQGLSQPSDENVWGSFCGGIKNITNDEEK